MLGVGFANGYCRIFCVRGNKLDPIPIELNAQVGNQWLELQFYLPEGEFNIFVILRILTTWVWMLEENGFGVIRIPYAVLKRNEESLKLAIG